MNLFAGWASDGQSVLTHFLLSLTLLGSLGSAAIAQPTCPTDLEGLTHQLLQELPSYTNRVNLRSRPLETPTRTYVVLAGQAEFKPLPVARNDETTKQVFFTTLEQEFTATEVRDRQHFHWLFLTATEQGWYLVTLFTRFGSSDPTAEPMPPRETSQSAIGQAIQLWLRDCRASSSPE